MDKTESKSRRLDGIQILRACAASMVVVLHTQGTFVDYAKSHARAFTPLKLLPLGAGVDVFFVISGFIIVWSSEKFFANRSAHIFFGRRLMRIVPLYWTALTLRLAVLALGAMHGIKAFPDWRMILSSYLFYPYDTQGFGNRFLFPILDLGWSLNFEMLFYVAFTVVLFLPREKAVASLSAFFLAAVVAISLFPTPWPAPNYWFQPIILEFVCGMWIAVMCRRSWSLPGGAFAAGLGLAIWMVEPAAWYNTGQPNFYDWSRFLLWGVAATLIVVGFSLGKNSFPGRFAGLVIALGDSSYALYLLHPFMLNILRALLARFQPTMLLAWPIIIVSYLVVVLGAHLIHIYYERPLHRMATRLLKRPSGRSVEVSPVAADASPRQNGVVQSQKPAEVDIGP